MLPTGLKKTVSLVQSALLLAGSRGSDGYVDDTGSSAEFNNMSSIAVSKNNTIYVADTNNNAIRAVSLFGVVTTFAGSLSGTAGSNNATGTSATFNAPRDISIDSNDTMYIADSGNNLIRKITSTGVVTTFGKVMNVRNVSVSPDGSNIVAIQGDRPGVSGSYGLLHFYFSGSYIGTIDPDPSTHIVNTFPTQIAATSAVITSGSSPLIIYTTKTDDQADLYKVTPVSRVEKKVYISILDELTLQSDGSYYCKFFTQTNDIFNIYQKSITAGQFVDILGYSDARMNITNFMITDVDNSTLGSTWIAGYYTFSFNPTTVTWAGSSATAYFRTFVESVTYTVGSVTGGSLTGGYCSNLQVDKTGTKATAMVGTSVVSYLYSSFSASLSSNDQTSGAVVGNYIARNYNYPIDIVYIENPNNRQLFQYRSKF